LYHHCKCSLQALCLDKTHYVPWLERHGHSTHNTGQPLLILNAAMEGIKAACSLQKYAKTYEKLTWDTQFVSFVKKSMLMTLYLLEMNAGWISRRGDGLGSRLK